MAWDCRISWKREPKMQVLMMKSFFWSLLLLLTLSLPALTNGQTLFHCAEIQNCSCYRESSENFEINCPKHTGMEAETIDKITAKVSYDGMSSLRTGTVNFKCDSSNPGFEWNLLHELNLNKTFRGFTITELLIDSCNYTVPKNQSVTELLKHFEMDPRDLKHFRFKLWSNFPGWKGSFPDYMFPFMGNLTYLNIASNQLKSFPALSLFPNLKTLDAQSNGIEKIRKKDFELNPKLQNILLSDNGIQSIEDGSFPDGLLELYLNKNNISRVTRETFSNLKSLRKLYLNTNDFKEFSLDAVSNLRNLTALYMDGLKLKFYPTLENLPSLQKFSMSFSNRSRRSLQRIQKSVKREQPVVEATRATLVATENIPEYDGTIKELPALTRLDLVSGGFKALPRLEALPNLTEFYMSDNRIQIIPANAFFQLMSLKTLDLSINEIHAVNPIQGNILEKLNLNDNMITSIDAVMFQHLLSLKKLYLARNQIRFINASAFESLGRLEELDLSYNQITFADGLSIESPIRRCENLNFLDISHNELGFIPADFLMFKNISRINMSFNKLTHLETRDVNFWHRNVSLSLGNNLIEKVDFNNFALLIDVNAYDQITIDLEGNPVVCDCNILALKLLPYRNFEIKLDGVLCNGPSEPRNLTDASLTTVAPEDLKCRVNESFGCPEPCECWRQPYGNGNSSSVIIVDCKRKLDIAEDASLPKVDQLKVKDYPQDYKMYDIILDLSENNISAVPEDYVKGLSPVLRIVDLRRNRLHSVQFLGAMSGNNKTRFNLSENLFSCEDCSFHLFSRSQLSRIADSEYLTCMEGASSFSSYDENISKKALEYPYDDVCANQQYALVLIPCFVLLAMFSFCLFVYFRYGWAIRAYLYSKGFGYFLCDSGMDDDQEKIYDAFVSYSHGDESWVLDNLVNPLETDQGFKLCLHFRDWVPGDWIPDQIVRSVDQSRRTVVVLSKNFVDSIWSRLEFKAAHSRALSDRSNRLILILKGEDLTEKDVQDDDLRVYMKMNTYIKWNDPWFWHKLKYALPHRRFNPQDTREQFEQIQQRDRAMQLEKLRKKMENHVAT